MNLLEAYRKNPCATLSIPYWKSKVIAIPPHMRIVHDSAFIPERYKEYNDERYFRLFHSLAQINCTAHDSYRIRTAAPTDIPLMTEIINRSYTDLSVTPEQLRGYTQTSVYRPELWILAEDVNGQALGCAIAELDGEIREGVIEWVQVQPEYRGQKIGQLLVNELLRRLSAEADFATVSGKLDSPSRPELLYRKCGFTGSDVWHILTRKDAANPN